MPLAFEKTPEPASPKVLVLCTVKELPNALVSKVPLLVNVPPFTLTVMGLALALRVVEALKVVEAPVVLVLTAPPFKKMLPPPPIVNELPASKFVG